MKGTGKVFNNLPVQMNPIGGSDSKPNYWLSCLIIDKDAMADTSRSDRKATYRIEKGKSSPSEILDVLSAFNAEGRPIWKPMHMQPMYRNNGSSQLMEMAEAHQMPISRAERRQVSMRIFLREACVCRAIIRGRRKSRM